MVKTGEQFIHSKDTDLHHSQEVESVIGYLRVGGEKIPNIPEAKIGAYLGFLANKELVNDGVLTGDSASIARQIDVHVIKPDEVPQSYFDLQRRIAREQGHGDIAITDDMQHQLTEALQADQRTSLSKWAEYVNGPDGTYPDWFEYYAWEAVTKLGRFDKEKGEFGKRNKSTVAPYPELNREALAYVYDKLIKSLDDNVASEPEQLQRLLTSGNFGKLYAHALLEATSAKEILETTEGSWKKYEQTDDQRTSRRLSESLAGYGTGWCTAGESTAYKQLKGGDFYVYYTRDEDGKDTTPRIAIRMENGQVAEVRGILDSQELGPDFYDIVQEKLADLPGGSEYAQKAEDMRRLTKLDVILRENPDIELSVEDLSFIHELDRSIKGFGYGSDPRIYEIKRNRNLNLDMQAILGISDEYEIVNFLIKAEKENDVVSKIDEFTDLTQADIANLLIDAGCRGSVSMRLNHFTKLDEFTINRLISEGYSSQVAFHIHNYPNLDHTDIANRMIDSGRGHAVADFLDGFANIDHYDIANRLIEAGRIKDVFRNIDKFTGLTPKQHEAILRKSPKKS